MKKYLFIISFIVSQLVCFAQVNEVELVVTSSGETKDKAINNGLRMAIEQSYGVFVSSNTTLLDDELVKDQIVTLSSGNIKNYKEISFLEMPSGQVSVTLRVLVSVKKLTEYAESHGALCEFKGAVIGANVKLQRLYEENERIVLNNLYEEVSKIDNIVDVDINVESATIEGVKVKITLKATKNLQAVNEMIFNTLASIGLTKEEIETRKSLGLQSYENKFLYKFYTDLHTDKQNQYLEIYTRNRYYYGIKPNYDGSYSQVQLKLLSIISNKINEFKVSCNLSAPVNFEIPVNEVNSNDFYVNRIDVRDYNYYYSVKYGHPTIVLNLHTDYSLPNTVWSFPKKGRHKDVNEIMSSSFHDDIVLDKTVECKYKDITGRVIGSISWLYEIDEQTISNLNGFYVEPISY